MWKSIPILFLFVLVSSSTHAQDVEGFWTELNNRIKNDPLRINGGVSGGLLFSDIQGIPARRDGFNWNLNANLNIDLIGIQIPFSAHISDGNALYNLPSYQFVGISPTYKWITLHAGDRMMNFSPYTLSGHNFTGIGLELNPNKFRFSAMYGRLKRAVAGDFTANQNLDPAYRRMGYGFKVGYGDAEDFIDLVLFGANDDINSLDTAFIDNLPPANNVVMGIVGRKKIGKNLAINVDFSRSVLTADKFAPMLASNERNAMNSAFGLIDPRSSTYAANAFRTDLTWAFKKMNWRLAYERIDPNYRSLGTLYINNDLESYTVGTGFALLKNKLSITLNGGLQRNNLDDTQAAALFRYIGSVGASATLSERTNLSASYSNFYNTQKVRAFINPTTPVDSLFFAQINQNASLALTQSIGKDRAGNLMFMLAYQNATGIQNDQLQAGSTDFYNANVGYSHSFKKSGISAQANINVAYLQSDILDNINVGPSLGIAKTFFDNTLSTNLTASYTGVWQGSDFANGIYNLQVGAGYQFLKSHSVSFRHSLIHRGSTVVGDTDFTENVGTLNYGYTF